ncbi:heptaprenyl diphosphate synthase [Candidatus Poribacteria bacterium]|nr:heptaprenyl diphosphate synthase [Candidatus Poribacteria bacterium]
MKAVDSRRTVRISLLVALATVLSIFESQLPIPRPPWLRLGLANIITLIALEIYGVKSAVTVACVRSILAGLFGSLPMLIFSFPAALSSSLAMGFVYTITGKKFSLVGVSIIGAVIHNTTQLLTAQVILKLSRSSVIFLFPVLILAALISGLITGLIARYMVKHFPES